jgi:hypothetical protein
VGLSLGLGLGLTRSGAARAAWTPVQIAVAFWDFVALAGSAGDAVSSVADLVGGVAAAQATAAAKPTIDDASLAPKRAIRGGIPSGTARGLLAQSTSGITTVGAFAVRFAVQSVYAVANQNVILAFGDSATNGISLGVRYSAATPDRLWFAGPARGAVSSFGPSVSGGAAITAIVAWDSGGTYAWDSSGGSSTQAWKPQAPVHGLGIGCDQYQSNGTAYYSSDAAIEWVAILDHVPTTAERVLLLAYQ